MDHSLQEVIEKNEYDYLQAYNIFVKRKENELKGMIDQLSARNQDQKLNDLKMYKLELALSKSRK